MINIVSLHGRECFRDEILLAAEHELHAMPAPSSCSEKCIFGPFNTHDIECPNYIAVQESAPTEYPKGQPPVVNPSMELSSSAPPSREESRAARLLRLKIPFFVVKASEPYARQVVELIKAHEGDQWTADDQAYADSVLPKNDGWILK